MADILRAAVLFLGQPVTLYHGAHGAVKDKYPFSKCLSDGSFQSLAVLVQQKYLKRMINENESHRHQARGSR